MGKRGYHHGDLERAAVEAGLAALDALGLEGVGASEIARRVGVSHAAVYKRLGARPALLEALAEACRDELRDGMIRAAGRGDDPRRRFLSAGWFVVRHALRHPQRYRLMFAGPGVQDPSELADQAAGTPFGALLDLVSGWQAAGLLRAGDRSHIALSIFSTTHGIASLLSSGQLGPIGERKARALTDRLHTDLLDGLAP